MDELFQKAAEGYPLNTRGADWEKVNARLSQKQEQTNSHNGKKRAQRWLLLLLPVILLCKPLSDAILQPVGNVSSSSVSDPGMINVPPTENRTAMPAGEHVRGSRDYPAGFSAGANGGSLLSFTRKAKQTASLAFSTKQPQINLPTLQEEKGPVGKEEEQPNVFTVTGSDSTENTNATNAAVEESGAIEVGDRGEAPRGAATDTAVQTSAAPSLTEQKSPYKKERRFFVSVLAGPDVTTVKFRQFSEVGFQAGILFGYRINRRLAIEAGAMSVNKKYKSDGEYLNKSKLYLPPNTDIVGINGRCRMIELPLSLRYTFSEGKKQAFFAAAGLSSYLMQSESYDYDYLYLASGYRATYHKTYKNESRNWLSVLQLSAGVLSKPGRLGQWRVEPYYAIPLRGIGYGELPLSSFGLRVGFTSNRF